MTIQLIKKGQSPYQTLKLLATQPQAAGSLRAFFAPRCDCNPVTYIKEQINESNATIRDAIKEMIASSSTLMPVDDGGSTPEQKWDIRSVSGDIFVVLETYCDDSMNLVAKIKNNATAEINTVTIETSENVHNHVCSQFRGE